MKKKIAGIALSCLLIAALVLTSCGTKTTTTTTTTGGTTTTVAGPNFGQTAVGGTAVAIGADARYVASQFTASRSGTVASITAYIAEASGYPTPKVAYAIYKVSGGALIGYTVEGQVTTGPAGWKTLSMASGVTVVAGEKYWLMIRPSLRVTYYYNDGATGGYATLAYNYPTFPNPLGEFTALERIISIYATVN